MSHDPEMLAALRAGQELFNKGEFYEAHEIWEEKWNDAEDDDRRLLQGLIQVAAGFYKLQTGMPAGTHKLLEKAHGHLAQVGDQFHGVQLAQLLEAVDFWRKEAKDMVDSFQTRYDKTKLPTLSIEATVH